MMRTWIKILAIVLLISACGEEKTAPTETGLKLEAKTFADLPGWKKDNQGDALDAFMLSCTALANNTGKYLGNAEIKIKTAEYQRLCNQAQNLNHQQFRNFLESNFIPYLVTYAGKDEGKFTAYYEPILHVSYNRDGKYKFPIHAKPLDMIEFNPHDFDKSMPSKRLIGRVQEQKLVPYFSRREIQSGKGNIPVLLWADNPVDVFVMHIQGPAVAVLPDGSQIRISYADTNGREFRGIGSILLNNGELKPGEASMGSIKKWLFNNPQKAAKYMNENPRYVFHRLIGATGPLGAMGQPLTAGRSLAVDKTYVPLGALLWLDTATPQGKPLRKLVNAQDVGGAIKGAIRGDYYWGSGGDEILEQAGKMNSTGRYYILLPKAEKD